MAFVYIVLLCKAGLFLYQLLFPSLFICSWLLPWWLLDRGVFHTWMGYVLPLLSCDLLYIPLFY